MALQQNKKSKRKIRQRKASIRYGGRQLSPCPHCGKLRHPHRVCAACGYYGNKLIVSQTVE